jgi:hypothetical protein
MRVNHVEKARQSKTERNCRICGHAIQPGEAYKHIQPRYGPKSFYCKDHYPRPSHLTSAKIGPLLDAQEDTREAVQKAETAGEIMSVLQDLGQTAEAVRDDYQDGFDAMPEGLQCGSTGEEIQEKIDSLEQYSSDLEEAATEIEQPEDDEASLDDHKNRAQEAIDSLEY